jgi:hypothetical protein
MDWTDLALDRDQWRALVNTVMNLRIYIKVLRCYWVLERLLASKEKLGSVDLVSRLCVWHGVSESDWRKVWYSDRLRILRYLWEVHTKPDSTDILWQNKIGLTASSSPSDTKFCCQEQRTSGAISVSSTLRRIKQRNQTELSLRASNNASSFAFLKAVLIKLLKSEGTGIPLYAGTPQRPTRYSVSILIQSSRSEVESHLLSLNGRG